MSLEQTLREILRAELRAAVADALGAQRPAEGAITIAAAAKRVDMSTSYIRAEIACGRLPAERFGRAVRVRVADVDALATRRRPSNSDARSESAARALGLVAGGR